MSEEIKVEKTIEQYKEDIIHQILEFIRELKHDNLYSDSGAEARDIAIQFLMDFIVKIL